MAIVQFGQAGEIVTGPANKVQLDVQSYDGAVKVSARQWFTTEEDPGKWIPTKKGFILTIDQARALAHMILAIDPEVYEAFKKD